MQTNSTRAAEHERDSTLAKRRWKNSGKTGKYLEVLVNDSTRHVDLSAQLWHTTNTYQQYFVNNDHVENCLRSDSAYSSRLVSHLQPRKLVSWRANASRCGLESPETARWDKIAATRGLKCISSSGSDMQGSRWPKKNAQPSRAFFYFLFFSTFEGLISDRSFNFGLVASIFQGKTSPWSEISLHFTSRGRFAWYMLYFVSSQNIVSNLNLGKKKKLDHTAYSLHCGGRTSSTRKK